MATTARTGTQTDLGELTRLDYAGIGLAAVTGVIHLVLGVGSLDSPFGVPFLLAGVGFFAGIAAVVRGYRRRLAYLLGIPFTLGQIVLYFALNWPDVFSPFGLFDKVVQAALVVVLVLLYRGEA
jgi:hypothetical protein